MNKNELANKIRGIDGLTNDEKSALIGLLRKQKKYGLVWEDKPEDVEERLREELPVLIEDTGKAIISGEADAPNHILIEGDNLEALDKEDSYRHSKWLSFMSKRLRIAKRLLSDKGVIFISIDDNEQAQLKLLCDEVFGQDKFVATIPWRKRTAKSDVPHYLSQDYEWVLCYANEDYTAGIQKETRKYYETDDFPNRPWRVHDLTKQTTAIERPNSFFTITNPKNKEEYPANPNRTWAITKETFEEYYKQNRIVFPGDYDFLKISKPALRYWKEDDEAKTGERFGFTTVSSYINENVGMTQDGTKDITEIFGEKAFGFPKPLSLIKYILKISNPHFKELIILDFFAGSGTTLHATMQLNAEDGGHRKCILVTNNENNICEEVTYERNKRVIQGYTTPKGEEVPGLTGNTLRYYRTDFISRDRSPRNMRALVAASTDLLCIKNDIYKEAKLAGRNINPKIARYFAEGGRSMLVIYDERAVSAIAEILETVEPGKEKIKVYVFSAGSYAYDDEFEEVADKVQLCALPDAIYQAYQKVLPRRRPKFLPEVMEEAGQSKANENGMFHFTDKEAEA